VLHQYLSGNGLVVDEHTHSLVDGCHELGVHHLLEEVELSQIRL
jgi:hypothetical protein